MKIRAAAKGRSLFRLAAAALLLALVFAPQIAAADAAGYPETRDRVLGFSEQVGDLVEGPLSRLSQSGYRLSYDEQVVGSLLVPETGASRIRAIREALSDANGRLLRSPEELAGVKDTIRAIESRGSFRLGGAVKYRGNQGIDLYFEGIGDNAGRFALAEAKASSGLASLSKDTLGIRQGSYEFFRTRLARGIAYGDPSKRGLYRSMYGQLRSGQVDLYGYFGGSARLGVFNPGSFARNVNFRRAPGAISWLQ